MKVLRLNLMVGAVLAMVVVGNPDAGGTTESTSWVAIPVEERQVQWAAQDLSAAPHLADVFIAPLGYRVERYFWRAQKPAGAFAIAVLRDLTDDTHYLGGKVDLMAFATTVLKGLEAPTPKALEAEDIPMRTASGMGMARRFELGARQCLAIGIYGAPNGAPPAEDVVLTEGSLRLDGVYCAAAGEEMAPARAKSTAEGLRLGHAPEPESDGSRK